MTRVDICGPEDRGQQLIVEGAGRILVVFWIPGRELPVVVDARCPHAGAPMQDGWVDRGAVICPFHHYRFSPEDGVCENARRLRLPTFPVELINGRFVSEVTNSPLGTARYRGGSTNRDSLRGGASHAPGHH